MKYSIGQEVELTRIETVLENRANGERRLKKNYTDTLLARVVKIIEDGILVSLRSKALDHRRMTFLFDVKTGEMRDANLGDRVTVRIDPVGTRRAGKKTVYSRDYLPYSAACPRKTKVGDLVDFSTFDGLRPGPDFDMWNLYRVAAIHTDGTIEVENQDGVIFSPPLRMVSGILLSYYAPDRRSVVAPALGRKDRWRPLAKHHLSILTGYVDRYAVAAHSIDPKEWRRYTTSEVYVQKPGRARSEKEKWYDKLVAKGKNSLVTVNQFGGISEIPTNKLGVGETRNKGWAEVKYPRPARWETHYIQVYVPFSGD